MGSRVVNQCMLCGGAEARVTPYFFDYKGGEVRIVKCASCGLGTLHPMLSEEEVLSLYDDGYFEQDYHCGVCPGKYEDEVEHLQEEFRPHLKIIRKFKHEGRFLEVGCAGGAMLSEARASGYDTVGVELVSQMAEWGRRNLGLNIMSGSLEEQEFPSGSFDVVFLGDVVEHLLHPREVLTEVRRVLRPDGVIALAYPMELNHLVPRVRTLFNLRKQSPFKPYHLFYYTPATLGRLLESSGFRVELHRITKMVRKEPLAVKVIDAINFIGAAVTGLWGDRGFTIGRAASSGAATQ